MVDDAPARAQGDDHLRHAEPGKGAFVQAVDEQLGLVLGQLQHRDGAQQLGVVVDVELERPDPRGADEPLAVEREPSAAGEGRERLRREVAAREGRRVHPGHAGQANLVGRPGVGDRLDKHPAVFAVVVDREGGGPAGVAPLDRESLLGQRRQHARAVRRRALGHDQRANVQRAQRPGRVVRAAADPGRSAVDAVE